MRSEELGKRLDGLSVQLAELKDQLERMRLEQGRGKVRAMCISLVSLLLGLLIDLLKS
ncbi:hypothetical protein ACIBAG_40645 [Streptomyces sp. NPDC051243]|uniref:hypothetical protein n=1 Tax=Streptomyces sp. NPDC051243 TaxID=3365646 RepID=UPI00379B8C78